MLESINLISCNFSHLRPLLLKPSRPPQTLIQSQNLVSLAQSRASSPFLNSNRILPYNHSFFIYERKDTFFHVCKSSLNNPEPEKTQVQDEGRDWSSSILLFALWGALLYYCFNLAPDQTPTQDLYFLKKLLNLKGEDGFRMNQILVGLWYIMGLWPLVYGMLLLPTGRRFDKGSWLLPVSVVPFLGPSLYLLLRPAVSETTAPKDSASSNSNQ